MSVILLPECKTVGDMLMELGIPVHRIGFWHLCVAIPEYARNPVQGITKELYPYTARQFAYPDGRNIEHTIRNAILVAWTNRNAEIWNRYFPGYSRVPTNKQFISTLAGRLQ